MTNRWRTRMAIPLAIVAGGAMLALVTTPAHAQTQEPLRSGVTSMDRMMLGMLTRANEREIAQAEAILGTTDDSGVERLANRMVKDHSAALTQEKSIIKRLGYTSLPDTMATGASDAAPGATGQRSTDQQFVDAQVEAHRNLLNQIRLDQRRLRDDGLIHHVRAVEEAVRAHLDIAVKLQGQMNQVTLR